MLECDRVTRGVWRVQSEEAVKFAGSGKSSVLGLRLKSLLFLSGRKPVYSSRLISAREILWTFSKGIGYNNLDLYI